MAQLKALLRDIEVTTKDLRSPEAKSKRLAEFARSEIAKAEAHNRTATGHDTPYEVAVDGRLGAPIESVKPAGVIVANFDLIGDMLEWIGAQLVKESPVLTGRYAKSHVLFADDVEVTQGGPLPEAGVYIFVNTQPYARKIERGLSSQAPDGVYQAVAAVAKRRFGNLAKIRFSYRSIQDGGIVNYVGVGQMATATRGAKGRFTGSVSIRAPGAVAAAKKEHETRQPAIVVVTR